MRTKLILLRISLFLSGFYLFFSSKNEEKQTFISAKKEEYKEEKDYSKYAEEALSYCEKKGLSTDFFVLIDFSTHSGKKRMFIWDFKENKIIDSFLVSHGCGKNPTAKDYSREKPQFSNVEGSHLSSLGKYHIGKNKVPSVGYGEKYLLYGKDSTNSNALVRNVVIHPWEVMPDEEPYPRGVPESWGCPAVSPKVFDIFHKKIQSTKKNVLLWIIY